MSHDAEQDPQKYVRWDAEPLAVEYHIYRDSLASLAYSHFGVCADALDLDRTDEALTDSSIPGPGVGNFYLVTTEEVGGDEGTLGFATGAERSNFNPCP